MIIKNSNITIDVKTPSQQIKELEKENQELKNTVLSLDTALSDLTRAFCPPIDKDQLKKITDKHKDTLKNIANRKKSKTRQK